MGSSQVGCSGVRQRNNPYGGIKARRGDKRHVFPATCRAADVKVALQVVLLVALLPGCPNTHRHDRHVTQSQASNPSGIPSTKAIAHVAARITLPIPNFGAYGDGFLWVVSVGSNHHPGWLYRISPTTNSVTARTQVGDFPIQVAADRSGVWVLNGRDPQQSGSFPGVNSLLRIEPGSARVTARIHVDNPVALAAGLGAAWVLEGRPGDSSSTILKIDEQSGRQAGTTSSKSVLTSVAVTGDAVWGAGSGRVVRIDPRSMLVTKSARIPESEITRFAVGPAGVVASQGVTEPGHGALYIFNAATLRLMRGPIAVPSIVAVTEAFGRVWSVSPEGILTALTAELGKVLGSVTFGVSGSPWVALGADALWVGVDLVGETQVVRLSPD